MTLDDHPKCKQPAVDKAPQRIQPGSPLISGKPVALLLVAFAYGLGGGGMAVWLAFLFWGPWVRLTPPLATGPSLLVDACLCLVFFIQHSIMVRRGFRLWLIRVVHVAYHGVLYAIASGTCLLALVLLWQPVGPPLWVAPQWIRWAMAGVFLLVGIGAWWSTKALGDFDALGVKPALSVHGRQEKSTPKVLIVRGPYRWVRHPLYFMSLIIIWAGPVYTVDRLLHNLLWNVWIVMAATFEERDLAACFGDAYQTYRKAVPMLLPKRLRPRVPAGHGPGRPTRDT